MKGTYVRINHEGDKDDGLIGLVVDERYTTDADQILVQFEDGSGGWYDMGEAEVL